VKDLMPGTHGHNLVVKVLSVGEVTEKKRYDESSAQLVEAVVGDETGIVTFSAKNGKVQESNMTLTAYTYIRM
jgi:ssDNA-binding replication factor A large subunit